MFVQKFLIASVLAVCLVQVCDAIQCYKCSSLIEPQCGEDTFAVTNNVRKIDCSTLQPPIQYSNQLNRFSESCQKVKVRDTAGSFTTRDCHFEVIGRPNTCLSTQGLMADCTVCKGDLCNSAPSSFATFGIATLLAFVAAFMTL